MEALEQLVRLAPMAIKDPPESLVRLAHKGRPANKGLLAPLARKDLRGSLAPQDRLVLLDRPELLVLRALRV